MRPISQRTKAEPFKAKKSRNKSVERLFSGFSVFIAGYPQVTGQNKGFVGQTGICGAGRWRGLEHEQVVVELHARAGWWAGSLLVARDGGTHPGAQLAAHCPAIAVLFVVTMERP
jgi:hypothetical protein